jgi:hypothetical protein
VIHAHVIGGRLIVACHAAGEVRAALVNVREQAIAGELTLPEVAAVDPAAVPLTIQVCTAVHRVSQSVPVA